MGRNGSGKIAGIMFVLMVILMAVLNFGAYIVLSTFVVVVAVIGFIANRRKIGQWLRDVYDDLCFAADYIRAGWARPR